MTCLFSLLFFLAFRSLRSLLDLFFLQNLNLTSVWCFPVQHLFLQSNAQKNPVDIHLPDSQYKLYCADLIPFLIERTGKVRTCCDFLRRSRTLARLLSQRQLPRSLCLRNSS